MESDRLLQNDGKNEDCYQSRADQVECIDFRRVAVGNVFKTEVLVEG